MKIEVVMQANRLEQWPINARIALHLSQVHKVTGTTIRREELGNNTYIRPDGIAEARGN